MKVLGDVGSTLDNKLYYDNGPNNPPTSFIFGPKYIAQVLYQFSPPEVNIYITQKKKNVLTQSILISTTL